MSFDELDNRRVAIASAKRFPKGNYMDAKRQEANINRMIVTNDKYYNMHANVNAKVARRNINSTDKASTLQSRGNMINGNYRFENKVITRGKKENYSDSAEFTSGNYHVYRL